MFLQGLYGILHGIFRKLYVFLPGIFRKFYSFPVTVKREKKISDETWKETNWQWFLNGYAQNAAMVA